MIVSCPKCQKQYRLNESQFAGRTHLQVHCTNCDARFIVVTAGPAAEENAPRPTVDRTIASRSGGVLPEGKVVSLVVTRGPMMGKVFPLAKPRIVLGRAGTDVVLEDPQVSRQHCALEVHGANAFLIDLGSRNGTFVNNERVTTCELEHLSEFSVGANTLMLSITQKS